MFIGMKNYDYLVVVVVVDRVEPRRNTELILQSLISKLTQNLIILKSKYYLVVYSFLIDNQSNKTA